MKKLLAISACAVAFAFNGMAADCSCNPCTCVNCTCQSCDCSKGCDKGKKDVKTECDKCTKGKKSSTETK